MRAKVLVFDEKNKFSSKKKTKWSKIITFAPFLVFVLANFAFYERFLLAFIPFQSACSTGST